VSATAPGAAEAVGTASKRARPLLLDHVLRQRQQEALLVARDYFCKLLICRLAAAVPLTLRGRETSSSSLMAGGEESGGLTECQGQNAHTHSAIRLLCAATRSSTPRLLLINLSGKLNFQQLRQT